jgi:hypothetical protein
MATFPVGGIDVRIGVGMDALMSRSTLMCQASERRVVMAPVASHGATGVRGGLLW